MREGKPIISRELLLPPSSPSAPEPAVADDFAVTGGVVARMNSSL